MHCREMEMRQSFGWFSRTTLASRERVRHYGCMSGLRREHNEGVFRASLRVDGRVVQAKALSGSGLGEASGLAFVATSESEVLNASRWLPGRVLVMTESAFTRRTIPAVVKGAYMATFSSLVVISDDLYDLGHLGQSGVPVPVVIVGRETDHIWMRKAARVTVSVSHRDPRQLDLDGDRVIDVRPERRRKPAQYSTVAATPGVVRR